MATIQITKCRDGYRIKKLNEFLKREYGFTIRDSYNFLSKVIGGREALLESEEPTKTQSLLDEIGFESRVIDTTNNE